jgi:tetratricopeptide (TPR) repeat protein
MFSRAVAIFLAAVGLSATLSARQAAPAIPAGLVEKYVAASDEGRTALGAQFPVVLDGSFRIALQVFGRATSDGGDLPTGVRAFEAAIALARQAGSPRGEASALVGLTSAYGPRGYYDETIAALEAARKLIEPLNDSEMLAAIANNLGNVYRRRGEPDLALEQLERALQLHEADGRVDAAARTLNNIGLVYQDQYNGRLALDYFLRSLALKEKVATPADLASTLSSIGNLYLLQNDLTLALEYHTKVLEIFEKANNVRAAVTSLSDIGLVHLNAGRLDQAEAVFLRGLPLSEQTKVPVVQAQILASLGTILIEKVLGRFGEAMARTVEARERLESAGTPISLAGAFYQEGQLHQLMKHPDLAIKSYERATGLMERIRGLVAGDTEDRVRFFEDRVDPYYGLADVYAASGRAADAFRTVERARSRGLLDVLGSARSGAGLLTPAERARQQELEHTMVALTQRLNFQRAAGGEGGAPLRELEAEVARARSTRDAFSSASISHTPS